MSPVTSDQDADDEKASILPLDYTDAGPSYGAQVRIWFIRYLWLGPFNGALIGFGNAAAISSSSETLKFRLAACLFLATGGGLVGAVFGLFVLAMETKLRRQAPLPSLVAAMCGAGFVSLVGMQEALSGPDYEFNPLARVCPFAISIAVAFMVALVLTRRASSRSQKWSDE